MSINTTRQARKARKIAQRIKKARLYGRIDAYILLEGWASWDDDDAYFMANGKGKQTLNPRIDAAYWRGWNERSAVFHGELYIHNFS